MRNSLAPALLSAAIAVAPAVRAQEEPSKLELYGGYSYIRFNINAKVNGQPPSQAFNGNGGDGQLVYNLNTWLGVLGDVGGYWATNPNAPGAAIPYLFWAATELTARCSYALRSGSSRRRSDELRDRADWMAKPFRNDRRRGN